jgi:hypothetical protein
MKNIFIEIVVGIRYQADACHEAKI